MMMTNPEVAGLLYKKRGGFGKMWPNAWQYRFFAITKDGFLLYFDTENADAEFDLSKARGRLDLKSITYDYSIDPIEGAPTTYAIQIGIPNEEKWKLCADTKEIQARWCKVLDKFMNIKSPPKSPNLMSSIPVAEDRPAALSVVSETLPLTTELPEEVKSVIVEPRSEITKSSTSSISMSLPKTGHVKKRLKLAAKKDFVDQESLEWVSVVFVLNICFLGALLARTIFSALFYVAICNVVVGFTLKLRYERSQKKNNASSFQSAHTADAMPPESAFSSTAVCGVEHKNLLDASTTSVLTIAQQNVSENDTLVISGKPIPGSTYPFSSIDSKLSAPHSWSKADHRQFSVRVGPDYNRYKKKAPSGTPIYEPFAVDVFCAKQRVDHAAARFDMPDTSDIETNNPHVPPIFVIQIQIPSEPPSSFFSSSEDGPGWAVVMYFKITEEACRELKDLANASPAVKLFAQWCEKAPVDPAWRGRFKVINSCTNLEELGFPSMIVSYNAKPVLIRRTGTIFKGPNYMEMDIHVHKFANVAKQSIFLISSRCGLMFMQIGFVIEGREEDELPETLFACVAVNRPQEDQAEFIFDE